MICPRLFADGEFIRAACHGDHLCPHQLAQFHRRQPDAARRAQDQQSLARLQPRLIVQRHMAGAIGDQKGRRIYGGHLFGDRHADCGGNSGVFGQPVEPGIGRHALPDFQILDPRAQSGDRARHFHPQGKGQRRLFLIGAFDDQQIAKVQPASIDLDQHLTLPRHRHLKLLQGEWFVVGGDLHGAHRAVLSCCFGPKRPEAAGLGKARGTRRCVSRA